MSTKVAINGFGRIGRLAFRAMIEKGVVGKEFDVVAVADVGTDARHFVYQLKYDSVHGRFQGTLATRKSSPSLAEDDIIVVRRPGYPVCGSCEDP